MAERVRVAAYDGVQSLDVSGPVEVLAGANRVLGRVAYDVVVCAPTPEVRTESGLAESMRRIFLDRLGITLQDYRRRFTLGPSTLGPSTQETS